MTDRFNINYCLLLVDLVTLDSLSAAALLESSGRVEALASVFAGARPPHDPPPPVPLPAPLNNHNVFLQAFALIEYVLNLKKFA